MKGNVLIIEDERELGELIQLFLSNEGITSVLAGTAEEGISRIAGEDYDLVILDLNLPGMDGFEVLQQIRLIGNMPVIIVSARQEDEDMMMGFGIGADDYVSKPFSPKVLVARVRANLKRSKNSESVSGRQLRFGAYLLDIDNIWLKKGKERLELLPKEMALLIALAETPEKPRSQEDLYKKVWNNSYGDLTTVSVHIQRLRKKLEDNPAKPVFIKTSYGFGYYLSVNEDEHDAE